MRVIIAGSRDFEPAKAMALVAEAANDVITNGWTEGGGSPTPITCVLCGMCRGIDLAGKAWAESMGIPVEQYPANWNRHGKAAGPIRNLEMAENADALIAISKGNSRGTANMIQTAFDLDLLVMQVEVE